MIQISCQFLVSFVFHFALSYLHVFSLSLYVFRSFHHVLSFFVQNMSVDFRNFVNYFSIVQLAHQFLQSSLVNASNKVQLLCDNHSLLLSTVHFVVSNVVPQDDSCLHETFESHLTIALIQNWKFFFMGISVF